jgi:hypothetical protein
MVDERKTPRKNCDEMESLKSRSNQQSIDVDTFASNQSSRAVSRGEDGAVTPARSTTALRR